MKREEILAIFEPLTREQILATPVGMYDDNDLLAVGQHFSESREYDKFIAVSELILRSSEMSYDMIDYEMLYLDVVGFYRSTPGTALAWCYAMLAFLEQHVEGGNRVYIYRDLAEIYLAADDFNTGLALSTQLIHDQPGNVWLYNGLGMTLPRAGLPALAVDVLERGLELIKKKDPEGLREQMTEMRNEAREQSQSAADKLEAIDADILANFKAALELPAEFAKEADSDLPYPAKIVRLAELGEKADDVLYDEILAAGKVLIPFLIHLAYDEDSEWGHLHAINLLRIWRDKAPEEFSLLSSWLDQAEGNWHVELLSSKIGKIGGYTTQALKDMAADRKYSTHLRGSAAEALVERVEHIPHLRKDVIALFRTLFTRPEAYKANEEQFIARLVGDSLNLDARELYPEIKQVYDEDRLEPGWVHLGDVHEEWGLPPIPTERREDGLYLPLECKACGRTREHFTEYVLVDHNSLDTEDTGTTKYSAYILDHEVVCPKCNVSDQYELTSMAHLRLMAPDNFMDMAKMLFGKKTKKFTANPRVLYFSSVVFGEPMHPLDGLDEYRRQIALNPKDASLYARMGSLLRMLMRYSDAHEALKRAYKLAPNDTDVIIRLALFEHDLGDREIARELYQRIVDLTESWTIRQRAKDVDFVGAMDGLRNLKHNRPSPAEIILHTLDGKEVEHPSMRTGQPQQRSRSLPTSAPNQEPQTQKKAKRGRRGRRK